jgi:hypothetical protein
MAYTRGYNAIDGESHSPGELPDFLGNRQLPRLS